MSDRLISAGFGPISMPQAVPAASSEAAHVAFIEHRPSQALLQAAQ